MNFKRHQFTILKQRLNEPRHFIQVVAGPRQTGKTTMVIQLLEETKRPCHFVSADAVGQADSFWIEQQWESARAQFAHSGAGEFLFVIDEIQKIDNWSEAVKLHWDADSRNRTNIKLIILGSSQLLIQSGLSESLTGRFELIPMTHWSCSEMVEAFGLTVEQFAWFGGYPGAAYLTNDENRWKSYIRNAIIETTISKDILMLVPVRKPALLRNLFELGCAYSGQILSYNKMLRQLHEAGNASTLSHYLKLLDSAGMITGLEKIFKGTSKTRSSSPKLQVLNTALMSSYSNYTFQQISDIPAMWGRQVESAIGAHLANSCRKKDIQLFYWRDQNNEVDFVLEKNGKYIGIEVKTGARKRVLGIGAFSKKFTPSKILLVGTGGIPWRQFLRMDPESLF